VSCNSSLWAAVRDFTINNTYQKSVLTDKLFYERNGWLGHHYERVSTVALGGGGGMNRTCRERTGHVKYSEILIGNLKWGHHYVNHDSDWRVLKGWMKIWNGFYGLRLGSVAAFCSLFCDLCSFVKERISWLLWNCYLLNGVVTRVGAHGGHKTYTPLIVICPYG
jgi:hypothetical protein